MQKKEETKERNHYGIYRANAGFYRRTMHQQFLNTDSKFYIIIYTLHKNHSFTKF